MRATGIIRKIDQLGRLVIPKETRRVLGMKEDTPCEFFIDDEFILIRKYKSSCIVCGQAGEVEVEEVSFCNKCISKIKEL